MKRGGTGAAYLLRRLDILARYERGEFKSVCATAKAAGLIKEPSPLEQIQKLWKRLDRWGRKQHLEWTLHQCAQCGRSSATMGDWCDACYDEAPETLEECLQELKASP